MKVPGLARRILSRALPRDVRDHIAGDLEEVYRGDRANAGVVRARARYWRKTLSFSARFMAERLRERHTPAAQRGALFSALDLKLGVRMLGRYPGLTAVSVAGMAVAIAITAGAFSILYAFTNPSLPFDEGDGIVALEMLDAKSHNPERRLAYDFQLWRTELTSVTGIGAYRQAVRNLIEPGRETETARVTEMSAAGFGVTRVAALMGRALQDSDELLSAPPVIVIGHDVWRNRLQGDPSAIGRPLQLGSTVYTIVGVMPEGYAFPIADSFWIPLRLDAATREPRTGPALSVFGRLAPGATFESAQAELATLAGRVAAEEPETHAMLRPAVVPYIYPYFDMHNASARWTVHVVQMIISMLMIVVSVNVAILIYARTASRHAELAVRTALGASRARIVAQLFVEGLVIAAASAAAGLIFLSIGLRAINSAMRDVFPQIPFWWTLGISPGVVIYTVSLALVAASILGIVPALKATGRGAQGDLKAISSGGGSGMQLGRLWTFLIVAQVAFAVALLPAVLFNAWDAVSHALHEPGAEASQMVTADVVFEAAVDGAPIDAAFRSTYALRHAELEQRLEAEPGVAAVTFAAAAPGTEPAMVIEAEGAAPPANPVNYAIVDGTGQGRLARFNRIDLDFFDTFGVRLLAGRGFGPADAHEASGTVIVNRSFVDEVLGGGHALGRRLRYVGRSREVREKVGQVTGNAALPRHEQLGHWYEIVGVVEDFPVLAGNQSNARLYHAVSRGQVYPATIAMKLPGGAPPAFAGRLREISASVDPSLQLRDVTTQAQVLQREQSTWRVIAAVLGAFMLSVVGLVAAGIYAMMSFTVARRRREIGIRAALGADPRRILSGIFARALRQLALGAAIGMAAAMLLDYSSEGDMLQGTGAVLLPAVAVFMTMVGLAAAAGPARRGLRIEPTEALKDG